VEVVEAGNEVLDELEDEDKDGGTTVLEEKRIGCCEIHRA